MSFSQETKDALAAPLNAAHIKSRSQSGQTLSYVEGHHAIREANRIFGFDGWIRETADVRQVQEENVEGKWRVSYVCRCRVFVGETWRDGVGAGQGIDKDLGRAHESAIKEAETDGMKRALMTFGDPFGLALYDKTQEHVDKGGNGKTKVEDGEPWLASIGIGAEVVEYFKADCQERGFDWLEIAKSARGAQVRDNPSMKRYVEDRSKRAAVPV